MRFKYNGQPSAAYHHLPRAIRFWSIDLDGDTKVNSLEDGPALRVVSIAKILKLEILLKDFFNLHLLSYLGLVKNHLKNAS